MPIISHSVTYNNAPVSVDELFIQKIPELFMHSHISCTIFFLRRYRASCLPFFEEKHLPGNIIRLKTDRCLIVFVVTGPTLSQIWTVHPYPTHHRQMFLSAIIYRRTEQHCNSWAFYATVCFQLRGGAKSSLFIFG